MGTGMKAIYTGDMHELLKGQTCLIQTIDNDKGTFGVQFDNRALGKWAHGVHFISQLDFSVTDVHSWFGLSYATWLTIPRVLLEQMPTDWQLQFTHLLEQYENTFPERPPIGTQVRVTDQRNKLIPTPEWVTNYRHPDQKFIDGMKGHE
tara:strand:- start:3101 stop:3547 length:447 start_codon:yes stop_codon:yes gene_type:complete